MTNKAILLTMGGILLLGLVYTIVTIGGDHGAEHQGHEMVTIKSEREFIEHMVPHHEEAVSSANELLGGEVRLRPVRELAESIVSGQSAEIEMMKGWYKNWYEVDYQSNGSYSPMMRSLSGLASPDREKQFLEDMIKHHEMGIDTANQVLRLSINDETKQLAEAIALTQTEEIRLIKELLTLQPTAE